MENERIKFLQKDIEELQNENKNLKMNNMDLSMQMDSIKANQGKTDFERKNALNLLDNEQMLNRKLQENLDKTSRILKDQINEHDSTRMVNYILINWAWKDFFFSEIGRRRVVFLKTLQCFEKVKYFFFTKFSKKTFLNSTNNDYFCYL